MPIDPCGAMCDYIRRPYTTTMRPFRDSDVTVDIVWYPCKKDAPVLDVDSCIGSLDWWVQERELGVYSGYKVGEVPLTTRKYNSEKVKPLADGLHRCGTADEWANGAIFDPAVNRPRRDDGLPTCCGAQEPKGVVLGGNGEFPFPRAGLVLGGRSLAFTGAIAPGPLGSGTPNTPAGPTMRMYTLLAEAGDPSEGWFYIHGDGSHPYPFRLRAYFAGKQEGTVRLYTPPITMPPGVETPPLFTGPLNGSWSVDVDTYPYNDVFFRIVTAGGEPIRPCVAAADYDDPLP